MMAKADEPKYTLKQLRSAFGAGSAAAKAQPKGAGLPFELCLFLSLIRWHSWHQATGSTAFLREDDPSFYDCASFASYQIMDGAQDLARETVDWFLDSLGRIDPDLSGEWEWEAIRSRAAAMLARAKIMADELTDTPAEAS